MPRASGQVRAFSFQCGGIVKCRSFQLNTLITGKMSLFITLPLFWNCTVTSVECISNLIELVDWKHQWFVNLITVAMIDVVL